MNYDIWALVSILLVAVIAIFWLTLKLAEVRNDKEQIVKRFDDLYESYEQLNIKLQKDRAKAAEVAQDLVQKTADLHIFLDEQTALFELRKVWTMVSPGSFFVKKTVLVANNNWSELEDSYHDACQLLKRFAKKHGLRYYQEKRGYHEETEEGAQHYVVFICGVKNANLSIVET